jgi:hypothetical protein
MILQDLFEAKATIASTIARCKPYLSMPGAKTGLLYRGIELSWKDYRHEEVTLPSGEVIAIDWTILKRRVGREPTATPHAYASAADDFFNEKFGWRCRSAGTFATGYELETGIYGDTHIFLPIGKTRFVWSDFVRDMYELVNKIRMSPKFSNLNDDERMKALVEKLESSDYVSSGLGDAIRSRKEIMVDCGSYIAVLVDRNSTTVNDVATRKYIKDLTGIS